jgi:tetratricopeptide (TPR) repeat protein
VDRLISRQQFREAHEAAKRLLKTNMNSPDALAAAADAAGSYAGRAGILHLVPLARESRERYRAALVLDPHHLRALEGWTGYLAQAPRMLGGDVDAAFATVRILDSVAPARGLSTRILLNLQRRASQAATDSLVAIGMAQFAKDTIFLQRAAEYFEATNRPAEAAKLYERSFADDTNSAYLAYRAGRALISSGETARAESLLLVAWRLERVAGDSGWVGPVRIAWQLARAMERQARHTDATAWCDSTLAHDPRHAAARRMRDSLRAIR